MKPRLFTLSQLILPVLLVAGCSSNAAPTAVPEATQAPQATAEMQATVPAPAPTSIPPTVTVAPTATSMPPSVTPIATVAAEPSPEATTAPSAPVAGGQVAEGLCANPYYPVDTGRTWTYITQAPSLPNSSYTLRFTSITSDGFSEERTFDSVSTVNGWSCTTDGLVSTQFAQVNFSGSDSGLKLETLSSAGVTVPAANLWAPGYTWDNSYKVKGTMSSNGMDVTVTGDITIHNTIAGPEAVTVAAGSYSTAQRVDQTVDIALTANISGFPAPVNLSLNNTTWFAEGAGQVKSTSTSDLGDATVELVSVE